MKQELETTERAAVLVEDAAWTQVMGQPILEALPSRGVPYEQVDPFILVHEGRLRLSDLKDVDTKHPHRGSTTSVTSSREPPALATARGRAGHGAGSTVRGRTLGSPDGASVWHAEAIGADELEAGQADSEFRGALFWVNLARKDKQAEPSAKVLEPVQIPVRQEGDATVRVLVGEAPRSSGDARARYRGFVSCQVPRQAARRRSYPGPRGRPAARS